jgi:hypothetical protein
MQLAENLDWKGLIKNISVINTKIIKQVEHITSERMRRVHEI